MRNFDSGATRNDDQTEHDPEGFLSPFVLKKYFQYMHKHRFQSDGKVRDSDNWQKGMPLSVYMKSVWRHFFDLWREHRGLKSRDGIEDALMGLLFNVMGYAHQYFKDEEDTTK